MAELGGTSADLGGGVFLTQDIQDALNGAASPDTGNVFATMADVAAAGGETLAQTLVLGNTTGNLDIDYETNYKGLLWEGQYGYAISIRKLVVGGNHDNIHFSNPEGGFSWFASDDNEIVDAGGELRYSMDPVIGYHDWDAGSMILRNDYITNPVLELPNTTIAFIDAGVDRTVTTKEWVLAQVGAPVSLYSATGIGIIATGAVGTLTTAYTFKRTTVGEALVTVDSTGVGSISKLTLSSPSNNISIFTGVSENEFVSDASLRLVSTTGSITFRPGNTLMGTARLDGNWGFGGGTGSATSRVQVLGVGNDDTTNALLVKTLGGTDSFRVRDDGNVGVGVNPTSKFHVVGTTLLNGAFTVQDSTTFSINSAGSLCQLGDNGMHVGIGIAPSTNYKLRVGGSVGGQNYMFQVLSSTGTNLLRVGFSGAYIISSNNVSYFGFGTASDSNVLVKIGGSSVGGQNKTFEMRDSFNAVRMEMDISGNMDFTVRSNVNNGFRLSTTLFVANANLSLVGIGRVPTVSKLEVSGDVETYGDGKGIIVADATTSVRYRIYMDNGTLTSQLA